MHLIERNMPFDRFICVPRAQKARAGATAAHGTEKFRSGPAVKSPTTSLAR